MNTYKNYLINYKYSQAKAETKTFLIQFLFKKDIFYGLRIVTRSSISTSYKVMRHSVSFLAGVFHVNEFPWSYAE